MKHKWNRCNHILRNKVVLDWSIFFQETTPYSLMPAHNLELSRFRETEKNAANFTLSFNNLLIGSKFREKTCTNKLKTTLPHLTLQVAVTLGMLRERSHYLRCTIGIIWWATVSCATVPRLDTYRILSYRSSPTLPRSMGVRSKVELLLPAAAARSREYDHAWREYGRLSGYGRSSTVTVDIDSNGAHRILKKNG